MKHQRLLLSVALCWFAATAHALICPKTYAQIQVGMTSAQVRAACGEPAQKNKKRVTRSTSQKIETWTYTSQSSSTTTSRAMQAYGFVDQPGQSKTFVFDHNGLVKSASVSGSSSTADSVQACGANIQVGKTNKNSVRGYCGEPTSIVRGTTSAYQGSADVEVWMYQFNQFRGAISLEFEKGVLKKIME